MKNGIEGETTVLISSCLNVQYNMVGINVMRQVSRARNGVGAFVLPCKRITLTYCNFGGSSVGMRDFLRHKLDKIAKAHPEIEFKVVEKPGQHPVLFGEYASDLSKQICVRKWNMDVIENKLNLIINSSGKKLSKPKQSVISQNPSVRGIWSPFYVDPKHRFTI